MNREESRFSGAEPERLLTVLNTLEDGVVSVEAHRGQADVNEAAAALLGVPPGPIPAADFFVAVRRLGAAAINPPAGEAHLDDDAAVDCTWRFAAMPTHLRVRSTAVRRGAFTGRVWTFTDESALSQALEASEQARMLVRANTDAMLDPQVLVEVAYDDAGAVIDLRYLDVNQITCTYLGLTHEQLVGSLMCQTLPNLEGSGLLAHYLQCALNGEPLILNDFPYFNELLGDARRYDIRASQVRSGVVSLTWRDVTDRFEAAAAAAESRRQEAQAEARYRRLMDNSNIGMALITPDGRFDVVNPALCEFFGYDETTLRTRTWQELTAAEYLESDLQNVEDMLAGRIDGYRMNKQYVHASGHLIWGDLSVSCLRDDDGQVERFVSQITDITAEMEVRQRLVQRDQQNRVLTRRLQAQTERLKSELDSAAKYVRSILPGDLSGPVQVTSRYLPSRELGGDCFDYAWIDDDHLMIYLVDVSGHGIAPALMSISVHNMLRTGSLDPEVLRRPEAVLSELNRRFPMDRQDGHYFTVWYGVYERSTRTLRYSAAGHPAALMIGAEGGPIVELSTQAVPIGMFEDSEFRTETYPVPPNARVLVCSDGAFELPVAAGKQWGWPEFAALCATQSTAPGWTLDELVAALRRHTAAGLFEDDCSLILLRFD